MTTKTETISTPPAPAERPEDQRAIHIPTFLSRIMPYYGQPAWLEAQHWRQFVRNQPVAINCRDTLINNMLNLDWDIVPKDPKVADNPKVIDSLDYYKDLFENLEGDFDIYLELMLQDMLDLPFGACAEIGRWDDDPQMPVIWAEHVDAATLFPTGNDEYPVAQRAPDVPGVQVVFPDHAINRMYMTPRTEMRLEGWGMAPPQKIYIAIDMLFKGDQYYWKMLIDTPEAGVLDLINMPQTEALEWLDGFRDMFRGVDGFKIPVLYGHEQPAKWIPLNRPPTDLMYDKTYLKYAALVAGSYGLQLSDIGLEEAGGQGTLAGVIRGERQSKRTGRAMVRAKTLNHFNAILPDEIKFIWQDKDTEDTSARGKAMLALGQGLKVLMDGGLIDEDEGRAELMASSTFESYLDPEKVIEKPAPPPGLTPFGPGNAPPGTPATAPTNQPVDQVPAAQGGRETEEVPQVARAADIDPKENPAIDETPTPIIDRFEGIIKPSLTSIPRRAEDPRLRRLIKAATRDMFEDFEVVAKSLTDEQIKEFWLPEMHAATFDQPNAVESVVVRRGIEEAKAALERHLEDDRWWSLQPVLDKDAILRLFVETYEVGLETMALEIIRSLYEEGLAASPTFAPGISFDLVHQPTLDFLEASAADLVSNVDQGTKFFLKRMITSGVRQGLSSEKIAAAIRDGDGAVQILRRDDFMDNVIRTIREGLIEMTDYRAMSIVNTEISKAENQAHLDQIRHAGLKTKHWLHLGPRGITAAGNQHPCPVCTANEELGVVDIDYAYDTVFKSGGVDGEGRELRPPAHPTVCHCKIFFSEEELFSKIERGEYRPWTGFA